MKQLTRPLTLKRASAFYRTLAHKRTCTQERHILFTTLSSKRQEVHLPKPTSWAMNTTRHIYLSSCLPSDKLTGIQEDINVNSVNLTSQCEQTPPLRGQPRPDLFHSSPKFHLLQNIASEISQSLNNRSKISSWEKISLISTFAQSDSYNSG